MSFLADDEGAFNEGGARVVDAVEHRLLKGGERVISMAVVVGGRGRGAADDAAHL